MKFEQLLKIYWARSFLYGGKTQQFRITFFEFFYEKKGIGSLTKKTFSKRFELQYYFLYKNYNKSLQTFSPAKRKSFNVFLSKLISINHSIFELHKYTLIRLFLIRSFRGRCHAIGKPLRGQRTWSNANTSYNYNKTIRHFIQEVKRINVIEKKKESLNMKFVKKKIRTKAPKIKMFIVKKKKNLWF